MNIVTLTQQEHNEALSFMNSVLVEDRYTDYMYPIGDSYERKVLRFRRVRGSKNHWELVTPIVIVGKES